MVIHTRTPHWTSSILNRCRRSFCNESKGTIFKYGNFYRNDQTCLLSSTFIELLNKSHDVYTSLAKCRAYRRSRSSFTSRYLYFTIFTTFFGIYYTSLLFSFFNLSKINLNRCFASEHANQNFQFTTFFIDFRNAADTAGKRTSFQTNHLL